MSLDGGLANVLPKSTCVPRQTQSEQQANALYAEGKGHNHLAQIDPKKQGINWDELGSVLHVQKISKQSTGANWVLPPTSKIRLSNYTWRVGGGGGVYV